MLVNIVIISRFNIGPQQKFVILNTLTSVNTPHTPNTRTSVNTPHIHYGTYP